MFTPNYPDNDSPHLEILLGTLSLVDFTESNKMRLLQRVQVAATECMGAPAVFSVLQAAADWLRDGEWMITSTKKEAEKGTIVHSEMLDDNGMDEDVLVEAAEMTTLQKNPIIASLLRDQEDKELEDECETDRVQRATQEAAQLAAALKAGVISNNRYKQIKDSLRAYTSTNCSAHGQWKYTVGLIGKPSAGKSTFYNACTQAVLERDGRRLAAVAPHPFTTIEPNIGPGWFAGPRDDVITSGCSDSTVRDSQHGRDATGRRLLPVLVKDVAGLVPGAYRGRGKGNRFLNDLCDADVLVHVVDATGRSDQDGNVLSSQQQQTDGEVEIMAKASSPSEDAQWIREELHRWVYGNVKAKWPSVVRQLKSRCAAEQKPSTANRLFQLFSGYQAPRSCVELAALRSELDLHDAYRWGLLDLHRLVAHYLLIRFPICLALNKVDAFPESASIKEGEGEEEVVQCCQQEALNRGEVAVPVSAMCEHWILQKQSLGNDLDKVREHFQSSTVIMESEKKQKGFEYIAEQETALRRVLGRYGSTGVLKALSAAVSLRPPIYCYPVSDLDTEAPVGWTSGKGLTLTQYDGSGSSSSVASYALRDCLLFKPGSTVGDVYDALRKGALPHVLVHGEFVRAEGRGLDRGGKKIQVGRDTVIDETCCVLRIQTNRKSVWQNLTVKKF